MHIHRWTLNVILLDVIYICAVSTADCSPDDFPKEVIHDCNENATVCTLTCPGGYIFNSEVSSEVTCGDNGVWNADDLTNICNDIAESYVPLRTYWISMGIVIVLLVFLVVTTTYLLIIQRKRSYSTASTDEREMNHVIPNKYTAESELKRMSQGSVNTAYEHPLSAPSKSTSARDTLLPATIQQELTSQISNLNTVRNSTATSSENDNEHREGRKRSFGTAAVNRIKIANNPQLGRDAAKEIRKPSATPAVSQAPVELSSNRKQKKPAVLPRPSKDVLKKRKHSAANPEMPPPELRSRPAASADSDDGYDNDPPKVQAPNLPARNKQEISEEQQIYENEDDNVYDDVAASVYE